MIELTVKTLDSQNHQFTVEDDITVEQFKAQIAEQVNIPAATQRIIYCGRVLQDEAKLSDYDVNGKVVHLVQRAPPNATSRNRPDTPQPEGANRGRGGFVGFDRVGNAVYMGSMDLPDDFMVNYGLLPSRASQSLSASRLNVARRMLRRAEGVIRLLENPRLTPEQNQTDEPQEEEMTPIIEARVIVPNNADHPVDENAVIDAVENSILNVNADTTGLDRTVHDSIGSSVENNIEFANRDNTFIPTVFTSTPVSSTEDLEPSGTAETSQTSGNRGGTRCREMAELITQLNQLQARFAPFLSRYQSFMQEDPEISPENLNQTRLLLRRVSQVLHYFSHAYHLFSDIMVSVESPPPRLLRCQPILIQQSAVVQAGIPIQLEAQINVSPYRASNVTSATPNGQPAPTAPPESGNSTAAPNQNAQPQPPQPPPTTGQPNLGFVGLPFMPSGSTMRVITTAPIEIRTVRANAARQRPSNNGGSTAQQTATPASGNNEPQQQTPPPQQTQPQHPFGGNNVEFFMELNPDGLRGNANGPPQEFLQSIMQLVNAQMGGRLFHGNGPVQQQQQPQTTTTDSGASSQPSQAATAGQNSQARGNTQTHPTTATHTMSTTRPHIHMTQQTVQGGFDPFLPCYSHHTRPSRGGWPQRPNPNRQETAPPQNTNPGPQQTQQTNRPEAAAANGANTQQQPGLQNIMARMEDVVRSTQDFLEMMAAHRAAEEVVRLFTEPGGAGRAEDGAQRESQAPTGTPAAGQGEAAAAAPPLPNVVTSLLGGLVSGNIPDSLGGVSPTLDQLLQVFHQYDFDTQEDSLILNLVMLLIRNLRLTDLIVINSGNMTPLNRNRSLIQEFFVRDVCQNDTSEQGVERATERVVNDLRSVVNSIGSIQTSNNINLTSSIEKLLRHHIPLVIILAINLTTDDVQPLVNQLWTAAKQLLSLVLNSSSNGQQGVETVFDELMTRTMTDIPEDMRNWTISNSRTVLRTVINNLSVPASDVEQFIVRDSPVVTSEDQRPDRVEAMDLDYEVETRESIPVEEVETLPNVVWGSEPWHRQTPEDWVPIITRDVQKQRRQNSQPPFSDAYLSGMPSKRRKLISSSKPSGNLSEVITESVRQAVTTTGLTTVAPLETVAVAAGTSTDIQNAYRTLLRNSVQANLRDNEDFTPERFPNASNYFNGTLPE
ncbi:large proline-rich protein bag6 isoform X2 [Cylas formicarius]|uniref:large proline-rich protein bag6 isoform X2 n=1 Tax=Cylas formicarius TaxID=197179 RepID=UPI0029588AB2|nr:large proline-rich protein bag6 isoform X2 [Cylas formicarius]